MRYNFNQKDHKFIFAGFFNSAVDNFDLALKELCRRSNCNQNNSEAIIDYSFSEKRPWHELDRNVEIFASMLPFVDLLKRFLMKEHERNILDYHVFNSFLKVFYKYLKDLRHYYTHYEHEPVKLPKNIGEFLDYVLLQNSLDTFKQRVKQKEMRHYLESKFKSDYDGFIRNEVDNETKNKLRKNNRINFVNNRMFGLFIKKNNGTWELRKNPMTFSGDKLTNEGSLTLLGLVLSKGQMDTLFKFTKYAGKYGEKYTLQKIIAQWVYKRLAFKSPKHLFQSDFDKYALVLQMVEELGKVPAELYEYLNQEDKAGFISDFNMYVQDEQLIGHEVIMKRYEDKFAYFALRFLDEFVDFPSLRFQVNVGRYVHNVDDKQNEFTNKSGKRVIAEKISVFERLSKVSEARRKYYEKNPNLSETGWQMFPGPSYQFHGHSIGIWLSGINEQERTSTREANNKPNRKEMLQELGLDAAYKIPVAFLSIYELPALLYALLIEEKRPQDIEEKIRQKIFEEKNKIRQLLKNNDDISLPGKWRRLFNKMNEQKKPDWDKIKRKLEQELEANPLFELRKNYRRAIQDPKKLSLKEKGELATWLSKDIKRFTPKDIRKNWRGKDFAEFQALLSKYDYESDKLKAFMSKTLKFDFSRFPFHGLDFGLSGLKTFYDNYLEARKNYIENTLLPAVIKKDESVMELLTRIFHARFINIPDRNGFLENKLYNQPLMLPRGIFDDKPTMASGINNSEKAAWFTEANNYANYQAFYAYKRHYPKSSNNERKKDYCVISPDRGLNEQMTHCAKSIRRHIHKNEEKLRRIKRNDYFVFLMIWYFLRKILAEGEASVEDLTLADFYSPRSQEQEPGILSRLFDVDYLEGKIKDRVPLKKIGRYRRMLLDGKIKNLLEYFPDKQWRFDELDRELQNYEMARIKELFKSIHDLEKHIFEWAQNNASIKELSRNNNPNFRKYLAVRYIRDDALRKHWDELSFEKLPPPDALPPELLPYVILTLIRNKFAHNQLIPPAFFKYLQQRHPMNNDKKVGDYLVSIFNTIKNQLELKK